MSPIFIILIPIVILLIWKKIEDKDKYDKLAKVRKAAKICRIENRRKK